MFFSRIQKESIRRNPKTQEKVNVPQNAKVEFSEFFDKYDVNGDGALSKDECAAFIDKFAETYEP